MYLNILCGYMNEEMHQLLNVILDIEKTFLL